MEIDLLFEGEVKEPVLAPFSKSRNALPPALAVPLDVVHVRLFEVYVDPVPRVTDEDFQPRRVCVCTNKTVVSVHRWVDKTSLRFAWRSAILERIRLPVREVAFVGRDFPQCLLDRSSPKIAWHLVERERVLWRRIFACLYGQFLDKAFSI